MLRVNAKDFPGEAIHALVALAKPWGPSSGSSQRPQARRLQYPPRFARRPRLKRDVEESRARPLHCGLGVDGCRVLLVFAVRACLYDLNVGVYRFQWLHSVHIVGESLTGRAHELCEALQRCAMVHNFYQLGVRAVRLRTKNPAKVALLEKDAVRVTERVVIVVGQTVSNR